MVQYCWTAPPVLLDEATDLFEQPGHGSAAMVARDVGVRVSPDPLDAIGVGAVRWQEVKDHAPTERFKGTLRELRPVDAVIVDDEMDATSMAVARSEHHRSWQNNLASLFSAPVVWSRPLRTSRAPEFVPAVSFALSSPCEVPFGSGFWRFPNGQGALPISIYPMPDRHSRSLI